MVGVAFIIAIARAILVVAGDGKILDVMLYQLAGLIAHLPRIVAAQAMFVTQGIINFFVHSGSVQAMLTMPIMSPLTDVIGITGRPRCRLLCLARTGSIRFCPPPASPWACQAWQPFHGKKWAQWLLPMQIFFFILALLLLIPAVVFRCS